MTISKKVLLSIFPTISILFFLLFETHVIKSLNLVDFFVINSLAIIQIALLYRAMKKKLPKEKVQLYTFLSLVVIPFQFYIIWIVFNVNRSKLS